MVDWLKMTNLNNSKPLGGATIHNNINESLSPSFRVQMGQMDENGKTRDFKKGLPEKNQNEEMTREKYQMMKKAHIIQVKDDIFESRGVGSTIMSSRAANTAIRARST
jgi:hypothetical protein